MITSLDNKKVKEWTKLHQKKYRGEEYLLLSERMVKEAYKNNYLKTLITSLVKQGRQTQAAYADNRARALTDFIGNHNPRVIYTSKPIRLFDGDTLIVCSDGVTDSVKFDSIHEMVENKASTTAFNIKQAVKSVKNPRQDNYTAVVIKVKRNMYD